MVYQLVLMMLVLGCRVPAPNCWLVVFGCRGHYLTPNEGSRLGVAEGGGQMGNAEAVERVSMMWHCVVLMVMRTMVGLNRLNTKRSINLFLVLNT